MLMETKRILPRQSTTVTRGARHLNLYPLRTGRLRRLHRLNGLDRLHGLSRLNRLCRLRRLCVSVRSIAAASLHLELDEFAAAYPLLRRQVFHESLDIVSPCAGKRVQFVVEEAFPAIVKRISIIIAFHHVRSFEHLLAVGIRMDVAPRAVNVGVQHQAMPLGSCNVEGVIQAHLLTVIIHLVLLQDEFGELHALRTAHEGEQHG